VGLYYHNNLEWWKCPSCCSFLRKPDGM